MKFLLFLKNLFSGEFAYKKENKDVRKKDISIIKVENNIFIM